MSYEDSMEFNGKIFVVMEHLNHAVSLSHQISDLHSDNIDGSKTGDIDLFCKYTLQNICKALELMHRNDIVHGDLKASNILCDSERG